MLILAGLVFVATWQCESSRRRVRASRIADRQSLSFDDLYAHQFEGRGSKTHLRNAWDYVAHTLNVDPTRLRPSDRFDKELAPAKGYPVEDELGDLEDKLKELGFSARANEGSAVLPTVGEYVEWVAKRTEELEDRALRM